MVHIKSQNKKNILLKWLVDLNLNTHRLIIHSNNKTFVSYWVFWELLDDFKHF